MYLLNRLTASGSERQRDEEGFEGGLASKPSYGFSLVQGRRPYMEDLIYSSLEFGQVHPLYLLYSYKTTNADTHCGAAGQDKKACFFGCFDGHCGKRAAMWAKENLAHTLGAELAVRAPKDALTRAFLTTDSQFLEKVLSLLAVLVQKYKS